MESMTLSTTSMSRPSSMMTEQASARGVAPMTEMSFTVPATEILPMSPPGKKSGLTVCPSMVNTTSSTTAESSIESSGTSASIFGKCFVIWSDRKVCMSSPPAPWFKITFGMRQGIHAACYTLFQVAAPIGLYRSSIIGWRALWGSG